MAKYIFVYHGGKNPETEEEVAKVLDAWGQRVPRPAVALQLFDGGQFSDNAPPWRARRNPNLA